MHILKCLSPTHFYRSSCLKRRIDGKCLLVVKKTRFEHRLQLHEMVYTCAGFAKHCCTPQHTMVMLMSGSWCEQRSPAQRCSLSLRVGMVTLDQYPDRVPSRATATSVIYTHTVNTGRVRLPAQLSIAIHYAVCNTYMYIWDHNAPIGLSEIEMFTMVLEQFCASLYFSFVLRELFTALEC